MEDAHLRPPADDLLGDAAVVVGRGLAALAGNLVRVGGRQARGQAVPALGVEVDLRGVRRRAEPLAKEVEDVRGDVAPFLLLLLDADQGLVLLGRLVALYAGLSEVPRVEDLAELVDVGARVKLEGDLRAAGEVDAELQPLLHEDRQEPDEDQRPGGADRPPLPAEKVDVGLAKKFHAFLRSKARRSAAAARTRSRTRCATRRRRRRRR